MADAFGTKASKGGDSVTTLARYSWYITYEVSCSTEHGYLHARHARRASIESIMLDMLDGRAK